MPELIDKDARNRLDNELKELNDIFKYLNTDYKITSVKRLGKFNKDNTKPGTKFVHLYTAN